MMFAGLKQKAQGNLGKAAWTAARAEFIHHRRRGGCGVANRLERLVESAARTRILIALRPSIAARLRAS